MTLGAAPLGRDSELAILRGAVTMLSGGRGGIVWLEGEPGIGKSTLIGTTVTEARARGCQTYRAAGDELGQRLPLRALIDALGQDAAADVVALLHRDAAQSQLDGPDAVPAAIERFLEDIDRRRGAPPSVPPPDTPHWAHTANHPSCAPARL